MLTTDTLSDTLTHAGKWKPADSSVDAEEKTERKMNDGRGWMASVDSLAERLQRIVRHPSAPVAVTANNNGRG
jgi:hypothetical protein